MRTKLKFIAVASALLFGAVSTPAAQGGVVQSGAPAKPSSDLSPPARTGRGPVIGPGDVIKIEVIGPESVHATFTRDCLVGIDGYFEYPRIGRIKATDRSLEDIKQEVIRGLNEQLVNPQVTIALEQKLNKRVSVGGEVRSVGQVPYAGAIGVLEVIIRANGVTDQAAEDAHIIRNGVPNIPVDLASLLAGDASKDVALQDGDVLWVNKAQPVFVQGAVNTPGPYVVRRGTTVQQLLTIAGGVSEKGKTNGIKIQRPNADPKKKPTEITVKDYKTEVVKPGDTVIIPTRIL